MELQKNKTYRATSKNEGHSFITKVLRVGKTYVTVKDIGEPYYLVASQWEWEEIN
jgi:hypothetical protein